MGKKLMNPLTGYVIMTGKRLWYSARMLMIPSGTKRALFAKKKKIYAGMGDHVSIEPRLVPLYAELIRFHNNIVVARGVDFVTHDTMNEVFNRFPEETRKKILEDLGSGTDRYRERLGCIEVMDNVFIGSHSVILYNTRIGPNVIIASCSVVTKDCEANSVYAGVPARKVGSYDDFMRKRMQQERAGVISTTAHNQALTTEEIARAWKAFSDQRDEGRSQAEAEENRI